MADTLVQSGGAGSAVISGVPTQHYSYRGLGADGLHRVQVDERSADADGLINRKTGFLELTTAEAATKMVKALSDKVKIAVIGGRQQRNGNLYNVTVQNAAE